jgi:hypothetical protein
VPKATQATFENWPSGYIQLLARRIGTDIGKVPKATRAGGPGRAKQLANRLNVSGRAATGIPAGPSSPPTTVLALEIDKVTKANTRRRFSHPAKSSPAGAPPVFPVGRAEKRHRDLFWEKRYTM